MICRHFLNVLQIHSNESTNRRVVNLLVPCASDEQRRAIRDEKQRDERVSLFDVDERANAMFQLETDLLLHFVSDS